jgi:hypothetical protein
VLTSLIAISRAQTKPLVLIQGNGNVSIQSTGEASAGLAGDVVVGGSAHQSSINKHDQTMEIAQNMLQHCPSIEVTLDANVTADYIIRLNREGTPTIFGELGQSQIMVLNAYMSPIFISKKATVKNAVKSACNAVSADWQAHGRIQQQQQQPAPQQQHATPPQQQAIPPQPEPSSAVVRPHTEADVAVVMHTTAAADKYCKPETISSVLSDTISYLTSKGLKIGPAPTANTTLTLVVNRPITKWLEITVQGRDRSGNLLWSEKVSDGGWGHLGGAGTLKTLEKVHQIIDTHLTFGQENRAAR